MTEVPTFSEKVTNGSWICATCGEDLGGVMTWTGPEISLPATCPTMNVCARRTRDLMLSMYGPLQGIC